MKNIIIVIAITETGYIKRYNIVRLKHMKGRVIVWKRSSLKILNSAKP